MLSLWVPQLQSLVGKLRSRNPPITVKNTNSIHSKECPVCTEHHCFMKYFKTTEKPWKLQNTYPITPMLTTGLICLRFFWCRPFLKCLLNFLQYCLLYALLVCLFLPGGMWDLSSPTRSQSPCIGRWSPNTWPLGKSLFFFFFFKENITHPAKLPSLCSLQSYFPPHSPPSSISLPTAEGAPEPLQYFYSSHPRPYTFIGPHVHTWNYQ